MMTTTDSHTSAVKIIHESQLKHSLTIRSMTSNQTVIMSIVQVEKLDVLIKQDISLHGQI